jgi:hypothetical protein
MFSALIGFCVMSAPYFLLPLSLFWDFYLCLRLSFLFVSGHCLLHFISIKFPFANSPIFQLLFLFVYSSVSFFLPQNVLILYGNLVNFIRFLVLLNESFQMVKLFGFVGQIAGNSVEYGNGYATLFVFLSTVCCCIAIYFHYLIFSHLQIDILFASYASSSFSTSITILFVILLYRRVSTDMNSLHGNIFDASLLLLYMSFLVWVSIEEANPSPLSYTDEESILHWNLLSLLPKYLSVSFHNTIAQLWLSLSFASIVSLFMSFLAVVLLCLDMDPEKETAELSENISQSLWQSLSALLYTNILFSVTRNVSFTTTTCRIVQSISAVVSYAYFVTYPLL